MIQNNSSNNIRDIWYPFGSIINGWATIMKDKSDYTLEQYKTDVYDLYELAYKIFADAYNLSNNDRTVFIEQIKDLDFPTKNNK